MKENASSLRKIWESYKDPRLWIVGILGFTCGTPLALAGSTLAIWLNDFGLDKTTIGLFSAVSLPYAFRVVWAPLVDRLPIPILTKHFGRRRSWLLLTQTILMITIMGFSMIDIRDQLFLAAALAFILSCAASTHWTAMVAYQVEGFPRRQYGPVEGVAILGYRLGMVASGGGALYLAQLYSWPVTYRIMTLCIAVGFIVTLVMREPDPVEDEQAALQEKKVLEYLVRYQDQNPRFCQIMAWFYAAVICPFRDFMRKERWPTLLLLMFIYKLGDNLIGSMANIFYMELGFSKIEIANVSKVFGMMTSILGGIVGGALIAHWGILRSLYINAILHMLATLLYIVMFYAGHDMQMLYFSIAIEHITSGMRTTALLSCQMLLCSPAYGATQLALMNSLVSLGRTAVAPFAGFLATQLGWTGFFACATAASLPAIYLVYSLRKNPPHFFLAASGAGNIAQKKGISTK